MMLGIIINTVIVPMLVSAFVRQIQTSLLNKHFSLSANLIYSQSAELLFHNCALLALLLTAFAFKVAARNVQLLFQQDAC